MSQAIVYLRTSTKKQNPQLQLQECREFCERKGLEIAATYTEQASAYKANKVRLEWDAAVKQSVTEGLGLVVWRYDRAFRNRKEFVKFMQSMYQLHGIKVYSAREEWVSTLWDVIGNIPGIPPPYDEVIKGLMTELWKALIQLAGQQAEEESSKKSERVKLAVRRRPGKATRSYKNHRWGRKPIGNKTIKEVLALRKQGLSLKAISDKVYYFSKNGAKRKISKSAVHKLLSLHGSMETFDKEAVL